MPLTEWSTWLRFVRTLAATPIRRPALLRVGGGAGQIGPVRLRLWSAVVAFAVTVAFAAWCAYPVAFAVFASYDDEGYMLLALKGFRDGSPLYDDVYGQYGPAFYVILSALLTLFRLPVSHDAARLVTLGLWLTASALCGAVIYRFSRSVLLGCAVVLLVFWRLLGFVTEPLHPGCLLGVLLAGMVATATYVVPRFPRVALLVIGAAAATTALVKINVGGFAILSLVFAWIVAVRPFPGAGLARLLAAGLLVATPFALMAPDLGAAWAQRYALLVALSALALGVAPRPTGHRDPREVVWLVVGAVAATVTVGAIVLLWGTTLDVMLDAIFVKPLGQRRVLMVPQHLPAWTVPLGVVSVAAAIACRRWGVQRASNGGSIAASVLRMVVGLALLTSPVGLGFSLWAFGFALLPLAWVATCPPGGNHDTDRLVFARVFLPALALLQALHAYPVSGSQVDWGSFLIIPVGAICFGDGLYQITNHALAASGTRRALIRGMAFGLPGVLLGIVVLQLSSVAPRFWTVYRDAAPLDLPGAVRLHSDRRQAESFRWLVDQLHARCSTFMSIPGVNSLYLFADMAPPTGLNTNDWMYLLDANTQARIVARLDQIDNLCLIENFKLLEFFTRGRALPQGPLVQYLSGGFELIGDHDAWVLKIRRSRPPGAQTHDR
jgi:hypothetical protein